MTPFKKALDVLEKTNPSDTGVVSYGAILPGQFSPPHLHLGAACMAGITNIPTNKEALFLFHGGKAGEDLNKRYLEYILSPTVSPWRKITAAQPQQDIDFVLKHGYVLTDFNFPSNFFVNFLTAWRLSQEKPCNVLFWSDMVRDGVRPGTALMYTSKTTLGYNGNGSGLGWITDTGHNAFSLYYADLLTAERVNTGEPDKASFTKYMFDKSHNYTPCNKIWSKTWVPENSYKPGTLETAFQDWHHRRVHGSDDTRRFKNSGEKSLPTVTYPVIRDFCLELDKGSIK